MRCDTGFSTLEMNASRQCLGRGIFIQSSPSLIPGCPLARVPCSRRVHLRVSSILQSSPLRRAYWKLLSQACLSEKAHLYLYHSAEHTGVAMSLQASLSETLRKYTSISTSKFYLQLNFYYLLYFIIAFLLNSSLSAVRLVVSEPLLRDVWGWR
jgi:hypothetical protein